jgi:hypothetical protein
MIIKRLLLTDRARNHESDGSAINGGRDTNDNFIFVATIQIRGKKGVIDIEQTLRTTLFMLTL